ncbi:hypothetical protein LUZ61_012800 [Rhynchospora tenuis]|uniref:FK506-binding protein n=1 Tax=Rhynchospora tenuis TaxID=198213 RepID=A0AAD6A3U0_9POAL|nr:hypothetical protein LUZ61_012800 [Rhynchospora tenuis]
MAFWGVEVKPGKPYTHTYDETRGRLRISQATLGNAVGAETAKTATKTTVQCNVGKKSPVLICSLFANSSETCHLELEFEEQEDVILSVLGQRSVHLSGYFVVPRGSEEPLGEDIAETESEDSDYDDFSTEDEYESDFIDDGDDIEMYDDDGDMYSPSRRRKSGVVIEEIVDEEKPSTGDQNRAAKKKNRQVIDSDDAADDSQLQLAVVPDPSAQVDSEDEDGFPTSDSKKTEEGDKGNKKRKIDDSAPTDDKKKGEEIDVAKKKKKLDKKKNKKEKGEKKTLSGANAEDEADAKTSNDGENQLKETIEEPAKVETVPEETPNSKKMTNNENDQSGDTNGKESKKKKKKNKKSAEKDQGKKEVKMENEQPQQSRTFGNGLVVEEISMGRPNGKKATPGRKVFVNYIGKLQNGKIFDSNIGQRPFKFRLGVGEVIKGWDVGVSGMRVGDKRRLTVPPSMGYGDKSMGPIPKNSWLIFDVELVNVQ